MRVYVVLDIVLKSKSKDPLKPEIFVRVNVKFAIFKNFKF